MPDTRTAAPPTTAVDVAQLPPTQYLILETLAGRLRLGEPYWTFPDRLRPAATALEQAGLVWLRSGPTPNSFQVWPTDTGRTAILDEEYTSPLDDARRDRDQARAALAEIVGAVHRTHREDAGICVACGQPWPCPPVAAVTEATLRASARADTAR